MATGRPETWLASGLVTLGLWGTQQGRSATPSWLGVKSSLVHPHTLPQMSKVPPGIQAIRSVASVAAISATLDTRVSGSDQLLLAAVDGKLAHQDSTIAPGRVTDQMTQTSSAIIVSDHHG